MPDMPSLMDRVERFVAAEALWTPGARVVVALSGGIDSTACAHLLRRMDVDLVAAHVNHGLRDASEADATFVREWCAAQDPPIPLHVARRDPREAGRSLQAVAREQRYAFFADVAQKAGADVVATGHHQDDQAETVLLNLIRGSGPEGLAGMAPSRPLGENTPVRLVRPLLKISRADIEAYAEAKGLPWREDRTNASTAYRRNAIRHDVLPQIHAIEDGASENIARAAALMREYVDATVTPTLDAHVQRSYESRPPGGWLDAKALRAAAPVWQRRVILEALQRTLPDAPHTWAGADEVAALLDAQVGRRVAFAGGTVWRGRGGLRLLPTTAGPAPMRTTPVPHDVDVALPTGTLRVDVPVERPASLGERAPTTVYADADRLGDRLRVRPWRDGDRFRPLGLDGTKAVSDLLTNAQVPPWARESTLVLLSGAHIAWVVGHRLAHDVRVRGTTQRVARLRFTPRENSVAASHLS